MTALFRWIIPILVLLFLFLGSLFLFYPITFSPFEILQTIITGENELVKTVIQLRLPRTLIATMMGANLAVAGYILQCITRNPLASPTLLSVNAGAGLAMVVATAILPTFFSNYSITIVASIGGGLSWLLVIIISGQRADQERNRLILAGLAVSLFCTALTKLVILLAEEHTANIVNWLVGGISHTNWLDLQIIFPFFILSLLFCLFYARKFNLLALNDESVQSLGVNLITLRRVGTLTALLIVGSSVSVAGPISFIGLLVPHFARYMVGYDLRKSLPIAMLLGACLMLIADILSRAVDFPNEIPAGAVLALIGSPIFILLAIGKR